MRLRLSFSAQEWYVDLSPRCALSTPAQTHAASPDGSNAYVLSNHYYGYLDSDPIGVTAGANYRVQTYLRGEIDADDSAGCVALRIQFYTNTVGIGNNGYQDAATRCAFDPKQDVQWREMSGIFTPPANTTAVKIRLFSYMNSGWVAFDDVSLKANGTGSNLIPDPGFENSTSGWGASAGTGFPGTMLWRGTWGPGAPRTGTYSYLLSNWAYGYWQAKRVAIKGGEQVDLYTYLKGKLDADTTQGRFLIRANFYNGNGTFISYSDLTAMNPGSITTWTRVGGRVTAPATAATMDVQYLLYMSSGWVNIDDVEVTAVAPPVNYVTKYYYFNGQRVAMRVNGVLTYLHADHLGSTVLETNASGTVINDEKYRAFGKQRDTGIVGTDYQFTGQKQDASGLVYMNARFFDPLTGMFVSPDTIVPDSGNVFAYNRSMYVYGRVMNANDPSGHECELAGDELECVLVAPGQQTSEIEQLHEIRAEMEADALAAEVQAEAEWAAVQQMQTGTTSVQPVLTNAAGIEVNSEGVPAAGEIGTSGVSGESTVGVSSDTLDAQYLRQLPQRVGNKGPTSGTLILDGEEFPVKSGKGGPASKMPQGASGFTGRVREHAEGNAAAIMHEMGAENTDATLYINNSNGPCKQCTSNLGRALPQGSTLRVVYGNMYGISEKTFGPK